VGGSGPESPSTAIFATLPVTASGHTGNLGPQAETTVKTMSDATDSPVDPAKQRIRARGLRIHILVYVLANGGLIALDLLTPGERWFYWPLMAPGERWFYWPLMAWGAVLGGHYFFVKSVSAEEEWADQRAMRLHDKSYDVGHIDAIVDGYNKGERLGHPLAKTRK
jgi:hypothetical protein